MRTNSKDTFFGLIHRQGWVLAFILGVLAIVATPAAHATKTHLVVEKFGEASGGPGNYVKFQGVNSLAVDQTSGDLLVIDPTALTVSRFHSDGTPANFSALGTNVIDGKGVGDQTPENGFKFGSSAGDQQIAVDNSGTITDGNIYVTQGKTQAGNLVDIFAFSGEYLGQLTGAGGTKFGTAGSFPFSPCGVAVDATGNLFVAAGYENKVHKFDPSANRPLNTDLTATYTGTEPMCNLAAGAGPSAGSVFANIYFGFKGNSVLKLSSASLAFQGIADSGEARLLTVNPSDGHLYSVHQVPGNADGLANELNVSGSGSSLISTFLLPGVSGIAVDSASSKIYSARGSFVEVYGPLVTIPDVTTGTASITGDTSVTVNGTVDPDGVALEECFFEYGPTNAYGQIAPCTESASEIGTAPKAVHADLSGLSGETLYHYRLVAKNANDTVRGADQTFRTPGKPAIVGLWSADVGLSEATLKAQIN
ncbi:MAG TPA: hypothetical protein VFS48_00810, partial [Solirubrobacterales bacterium]|nr:hypothetical protein [Solirubrobacterales bacterium]